MFPKITCALNRNTSRDPFNRPDPYVRSKKEQARGIANLDRPAKPAWYLRVGVFKFPGLFIVKKCKIVPVGTAMAFNATFESTGNSFTAFSGGSECN